MSELFHQQWSQSEKPLNVGLVNKHKKFKNLVATVVRKTPILMVLSSKNKYSKPVLLFIAPFRLWHTEKGIWGSSEPWWPHWVKRGRGLRVIVAETPCYRPKQWVYSQTNFHRILLTQFFPTVVCSPHSETASRFAFYITVLNYWHKTTLIESVSKTLKKLLEHTREKYMSVDRRRNANRLYILNEGESKYKQTPLVIKNAFFSLSLKSTPWQCDGKLSHTSAHSPPASLTPYQNILFLKGKYKENQISIFTFF